MKGKLDQLTSIRLDRWEGQIVVVPTCNGCGETLDVYPFKGSHTEESLRKSINDALIHHMICTNPVVLKDEDDERKSDE